MKQKKWESIWGGQEEDLSLEICQASLVRPPDKDSMKLKTLEWLEVVTWDGGPRDLYYLN
jgi:hypothetical protein